MAHIIATYLMMDMHLQLGWLFLELVRLHHLLPHSMAASIARGRKWWKETEVQESAMCITHQAVICLL